MFTKSAQYYDRLYAFKDYVKAANELCQRAQAAGHLGGRLLDLGCGTGKHIEVLQNRFAVEGLDRDANLLQIARARCPDVTFHEADMTGFALDHSFEVITSLFSSIGYVRTRENLQRTLLNAARHLTPGGMILIEPWFTPDNYRAGTVTLNVVDDPDLKIAWMYRSERRENLAVLDIHYTVGTTHGIEQFNEVHELGLFSHEEYVEAFELAGLRVTHDPVGFFGRGLYVGSTADLSAAVPL